MTAFVTALGESPPPGGQTQGLDALNDWACSGRTERSDAFRVCSASRTAVESLDHSGRRLVVSKRRRGSVCRPESTSSCFSFDQGPIQPLCGDTVS
jgi:hypothetical protein